MSLKLDELRKRLLQQPLDNGSFAAVSLPDEEDAPLEEPERAPAKPELKAVESVKPSEPAAVRTIEIGQAKERASAPKEGSLAALGIRPAPTAVKADPPIIQNQMIESVGKLFEQTKTFQVRFDELTAATDVIDRLTESANRLFAPLRGFHSQLAQLSESFDSMRAFQAQLAEISKTFEPMKIVHDQLAQLMESIQNNLAQLVKALDPAKDFRDRIMNLARTLDQANELQAAFGELYSKFKANGASSGTAQWSEGRQSAAN